MAWTSYRFETDPSKYGTPNSLSGALKGLAVAPFAWAANKMFGDKNGLMWSGNEQDSINSFADTEAKRWESNVKPLAGAVSTPFSTLRTEAKNSGPVPIQQIMDTNWEQRPSATASPASQATPRPVSARSLVARPAAISLAPGQIPGMDVINPETAPGPMITENTAVRGQMFDSAGADITGKPGEYDLSSPIGNGGFGLTRNPDGTVDRMFVLRQRTPEEDVAYKIADAEWEKNHPFGTAGEPVSVDTSPGGHAAWVKEQELNQLLNRPLGLKVAKLVNDQNTLAETIRNNTLVNAIAKQNADTTRLYQGTLAEAVSRKLPGELQLQISQVLTDAAKRGEISADTKLKLAQALELPTDSAAKRGLWGAEANLANEHAASIKAKTPAEVAKLENEGKTAKLDTKAWDTDVENNYKNLLNTAWGMKMGATEEGLGRIKAKALQQTEETYGRRPGDISARSLARPIAPAGTKVPKKGGGFYTSDGKGGWT